MNKTELVDLIDATHKRLLELSATKGLEYAGPHDRLANFKRIAARLRLGPMAVLMVFLSKHMDSIDTFIRDPLHPMSEPIEGRIDDAILYLVLLKGLINEHNLAIGSAPAGGSVRAPTFEELALAAREIGPDDPGYSGSVRGRRRDIGVD